MEMVLWIDLILAIAIIALVWIQFSKFKMMDKILASFDNSNDGFSARKLSAFVGVIVSIFATFRFVDTSVVIEALMVWLCFALLCLGIITFEQVIRFRNKGGDSSNNNENNDEPQTIEEEPEIKSESPKRKP